MQITNINKIKLLKLLTLLLFAVFQVPTFAEEAQWYGGLSATPLAILGTDFASEIVLGKTLGTLDSRVELSATYGQGIPKLVQ